MGSGMEINENKLKEILNGQRQEFQHFMGIMKEDIESKMQLIGEQYAGVDAKLGSHTEMIASVAEDIHIIKSDIHFIKGELKKKVDYEEFESLEKRVAVLEAKVRK